MPSPRLARKRSPLSWSLRTPLHPHPLRLSSAKSNPIFTFQQTRSASSRSSSSSQWLQRQSSDPYVKARSTGSLTSESTTTAESFVSRSAFKLLELHKSSLQGGGGGLIREGMKIVDLGAAPGGWSQAIIHLNQLKSSGGGGGGGGGKKRRKEGFVIAVDLLELHKSLRSEERVYAIQGNFLDPIVQNKIMDVFRRIDDSHGRRNHSSDECVEGTVKRRIGEDKRVDLVVSDMLANLTGNILRDAQLSLDLCEAALEFSLRNLTPSVSTSSAVGRDGKDSSPRLVMKHLQSSLSQGFQQKLRESFGSVRWEKPPSCRVESREGYWICSNLLAKSKRKSKAIEMEEEIKDDELFF